MKKLLLLLSFLLVGTCWIVAQDSSYPAGQSPATGETTVQGCLNGSNGNFTLTDQDGTVTNSPAIRQSSASTSGIR